MLKEKPIQVIGAKTLENECKDDVRAQNLFK